MKKSLPARKSKKTDKKAAGTPKKRQLPLAPAEADRSFPVVGIGASAGAVEAFTQLLKALPSQPGMAFILLPHLDPHHASALPELLAHATEMPVLQVQDGMRAKADHVYVLPPTSK